MHEVCRHRDQRAIGQDEVRFVSKFFDAGKDVIPPAAVQAGRMIAQLVKNFVHLERGRNRLDQDRGADGAARNPELILGKIEDVVPNPRLDMALDLRQIKVRPGAAFEMDEILYELRDHSSGLNCGRWDYIFSCIKKFRNKPDFILADRALVTMTTHFMHSYSLLCIKTCHRRNTFAMGGMAAWIPVKNDPQANEEAFAKVRADKEREAGDGHDGTWVAHPGMVDLATDAFDAIMKTPNQIARKREGVKVSADDLLDFGPCQPITEAGLRQNVSVGVQYLEAWLGGRGAVPLFNLMEDAATCEISRAQVWQWIRHADGNLSDGRKVTKLLFGEILDEELAKVRDQLGCNAYDKRKFKLARELFAKITTDDDFAEFLTLPAYKYL